MKARNKKTGEIVEFEKRVNRNYDYEYTFKNSVLNNFTITEREFNEFYEIVEDPNHPYGGMKEKILMPNGEWKNFEDIKLNKGMEVLDNVLKETWEEMIKELDEDMYYASESIVNTTGERVHKIVKLALKQELERICEEVEKYCDKDGDGWVDKQTLNKILNIINK